MAAYDTEPDLSFDSAAQESPPELSKIRILGTSATIERAIVETLERTGFSIAEDDSSEAGITILDVSRPGEVAQQEALASLERMDPSVRVLLLILREDHVPETLRTHPRVSDVLMKPFRPVDLVDAIRRIRPTDDTTTSDWLHEDETITEIPVMPDDTDLSPIFAQEDGRISITEDTGSAPSKIVSLAQDLARMVPMWIHLTHEGDRAKAIAAWLEDRDGDQR